MHRRRTVHIDRHTGRKHKTADFFRTPKLVDTCLCIQRKGCSRGVCCSCKQTDLKFPTTSNVLQFFTEDGTKISVRPSGTEPKIKFYIEVRGTMKTRADYADADAKATAKIQAVRDSLGV